MRSRRAFFDEHSADAWFRRTGHEARAMISEREPYTILAGGMPGRPGGGGNPPPGGDVPEEGEEEEEATSPT
jgi:hypothetical protein